MSEDNVVRETIWKVSGYDTLADVHAIAASDPKKYFETALHHQFLKLRIEGGERPAADELLALMIDRILHDSVSVVDMLEIAEILRKAVTLNLAYQLVGKHKRGRSRRSARLCIEICHRVQKVVAERGIPIRDSTRGGQDDAIAVVSLERKQSRLRPWMYDTVKHYYDEGMRLSRAAEDGAIKALVDASSFIESLEEDDPQDP
jgi:hypothetical protein